LRDNCRPWIWPQRSSRKIAYLISFSLLLAKSMAKYYSHTVAFNSLDMRAACISLRDNIWQGFIRVTCLKTRRMHQMLTIASDDSGVWACVSRSVFLSVCHTDDCSYSFARWRYFNTAIMHLLVSFFPQSNYDSVCTPIEQVTASECSISLNLLIKQVPIRPKKEI